MAKPTVKSILGEGRLTSTQKRVIEEAINEGRRPYNALALKLNLGFVLNEDEEGVPSIISSAIMEDNLYTGSSTTPPAISINPANGQVTITLPFGFPANKTVVPQSGMLFRSTNTESPYEMKAVRANNNEIVLSFRRMANYVSLEPVEAELFVEIRVYE